MRDARAGDNCPSASINGSLGICGRVHVSLADDGNTGKLGGRLAEQRQIRTVVQVVSIAALLCESVVETKSQPHATARRMSSMVMQSA